MPIEFKMEETESCGKDALKLVMAYDGSGKRVSKTRERKACLSETSTGATSERTYAADWERELVTHYTGIGTEVRENYRDGSLQNARVVVKSLQGERRKNKFTCFYDRAAAAYAEGVHMPQGLGRYGVSDVILSDSEKSSNTQPNEFYLKNYLGSTMLVYGTGDGAGSVKAAYDYRATVVAMRTKQQVAKCCPPFGEQITLSEPTDKVTENFTGICPQGKCCENTLVYFHCRAAGHSALRQEKDDETDLNYFGARYLDPMIGLWISVDPKRQFASPYLYVGNGVNPENGVDPDGNIIKMYSRNSESYNIAANDALKEIENSGPEGKAFIAKLRSSDQEIIIKQSSKGNHTEAHGRNAVVLWDMNAVMGGKNAEGSRRRSTSVGLAHELGHSEDIIDGKFTEDERYNKDGIPIKEENSIKRENQIREDLGEPLREFY